MTVPAFDCALSDLSFISSKPHSARPRNTARAVTADQRAVGGRARQAPRAPCVQGSAAAVHEDGCAVPEGWDTRPGTHNQLKGTAGMGVWGGSGEGAVGREGGASVADGAAGHGHKQTAIIVPLKASEAISPGAPWGAAGGAPTERCRGRTADKRGR